MVGSPAVGVQSDATATAFLNNLYIYLTCHCVVLYQGVFGLKC